MSTFLRDNVAQVRDLVELSCNKAGRALDAVTIIAVTKTVAIDVMRTACEQYGIKHFGENYVQESKSKFDQLATQGPLEVTWHFIGHLQSNKCEFVAKHFDWIHSLDRQSLAIKLEAYLAKEHRIMNALIQVNFAGEASKYGTTHGDALELAKFVSAECPHIQLRGLMSFPPLHLNENELRRFYKQTRELLGEINKNCENEISMRDLSMGLSGDFQIAIEEGSTMIRIGTALFGSRPLHGETRR